MSKSYSHFDAHGTDGVDVVWAVFNDGTEEEVGTSNMMTWLEDQLAAEGNEKSEIETLTAQVDNLQAQVAELNTLSEKIDSLQTTISKISSISVK